MTHQKIILEGGKKDGARLDLTGTDDVFAHTKITINGDEYWGTGEQVDGYTVFTYIGEE